MNQAEFRIRTQTDGILRLDQAVLIYRGASDSALATIHQVEQVDGEPVILTGQAMRPRAAIQLACALARGVAHGGFLPETVLYMDGALLLWWVPPHPPRSATSSFVRRSWAHRSAAKSYRIRDWCLGVEQRLEGMGGQGQASPDVADGAVPVSLFQCIDGGDICRGNVQVPDGTTAEKIDAWNAAFFGSFFTHPNTKGRLVRYRGHDGAAAYAFWRDMLDGKFKSFPERVLVDANTTLGQLLGMGE